MMKFCKRCNQSHPLAEFRLYPSGSKKGAPLIPFYMCRKAEAEKAKARYRANAAAERAASAQRYKNARNDSGARHADEAYLRTGSYGIRREFSVWTRSKVSVSSDSHRGA